MVVVEDDDDDDDDDPTAAAADDDDDDDADGDAEISRRNRSCDCGVCTDSRWPR